VTAAGAGGTGSPADDLASHPVQRELRDYLRVHEQRRRQLPRALLVGVLAGLVAVSFARSLELAEVLRNALLERAHSLGGWAIVLPIVLCALGAAIAVDLVVRYAPEAGGSGIPHLKAVLHRLRAMRWSTVLPVKYASGVIGIGSGLTLGREGPTVQMGGAIGQMVSGWFRCTPRERNTLIAAGAGAGLSAAFNAPLAGLVFVLEEVQRDFSPAVFTVTLVASVVADVTCRLLLGGMPVIPVAVPPAPSLASLPLYLALGVAAAPLGILFNRSLIAALDLAARLERVPPSAKAALVGATIGVLAWFVPGTIGGGGRIVGAVLTHQLSVAQLLWLLPLRLVLTSASYGTGAAGGIFTPMLVIGALLGAGVGEIAATSLPTGVIDLPCCAIVGMAAFFTAVVRAPLTAIVLLVEMTGDYAMVLPLLVACLAAGGIADYLRDPPIYEALLLRDLSRRDEQPQLGEALVLDLTVSPGSAFDGAAVRALGLPPGCIVIAVQRGPSSEVPTADFVLASGDRISVLVSPRAAHAAALLREGTDPPGHGARRAGA
jgi:CIC family chloride channel protein